MGRDRGPKFSFPLPGRRSHAKPNDHDSFDGLGSSPSNPSASEWSPRYHEPSSTSKAHRVLGTSNMPFRPASRTQKSSAPQSPQFMTVSVSEASFGSDHADRLSSVAAEDANRLSSKRPSLLHRASSNILGNMYGGDSRRGSDTSTASRRVHAKTSNSTLRSYYDPQASPPSISQQTSASAVRDMALRKGQPPITRDEYNHVTGSSSRTTPVSNEVDEEERRGRPARLDLSKLFPKPQANGTNRPLLSPSKLVKSPTAMSTASDYFPRPMTRDPTPTPTGHATLKPARPKKGPTARQPDRTTSPVRKFKRDTYDNAKINIRRPPRGIQHWFDGLGEESDEEEFADEHREDSTPTANDRNEQHRVPTRKSSLGRLLDDGTQPSRQKPPSKQSYPKKEEKKHFDARLAPRVLSPSQFSIQSQSSYTMTKDINFPRNNLQSLSMLSISSSEDEDVGPRNLRDSIASVDDHEEAIIGQAQAYEVGPVTRRKLSDSKLSMLTTSTNAATIEVMYTPEPYTPQFFPRSHGSRRSSHARHPSIIPEDESVRPSTSANAPMSDTMSIRSVRTSASEPRSRTERHKLMVVTAEEEALLEMMRQKRAAMDKQSFAEGYMTAAHQGKALQKTPLQVNPPRTSGFLSMESPVASPARPSSASHKSLAAATSPLLIPQSRGRRVRQSRDMQGSSVLHDSSSFEDKFDRHVSTRATDHRLSPPPEFSPIELFPSSMPTPTVASSATTDRASPIPSPVTPGFRNGEGDVDVKVASSEPSCSGDNDDVAVLDMGVIDPPAGSIKTNESRSSQMRSPHQRRRSASSGTEGPFGSPRMSTHMSISTRDSHDQASVSQASTGAPSITDPRLPRKSSRRATGLTVSTTGLPRSRTSSVYSQRTPLSAMEYSDRRTSKVTSRSRSSCSGSVHGTRHDAMSIGSPAGTRCSVSEDVLAAWSSLGGGRIGGY